MSLLDQYIAMRALTEQICSSLEKEDYVVQPVADVSPPKWHLGHTTWFFETFLLIPYAVAYQPFNPDYNYVFNSYYETVGARVIRTDRGNLSRPTVDDVYKYRAYVDKGMTHLLSCGISEELKELFTLGINHEQQHQELLWYDIKYIFGHNPLFPVYGQETIENGLKSQPMHEDEWLVIPEGIYEIGYVGEEFHFDNELGQHKLYVNSASIAKNLVTNGEFKKFIAAGGYRDFNFWHAEGWDWVRNNGVMAPLYWHEVDGSW
ncbi:MAG: ergothioneine biosynthesis protein EgtB, partial [Pedobacter sp.]